MESSIGASNICLGFEVHASKILNIIEVIKTNLYPYKVCQKSYLWFECSQTQILLLLRYSNLVIFSPNGSIPDLSTLEWWNLLCGDGG